MFHFYLQNSPKLVLTQRENSFTAKCSINLHPCRQGDQLGKLEIKSCCSCRGCFAVGEAALRCLNNTLRNYRLAHAHTFPSLKHLNSNLLRLGKKCNSPFCAKQVPFRIVIVSHIGIWADMTLPVVNEFMRCEVKEGPASVKKLHKHV